MSPTLKLGARGNIIVRVVYSDETGTDGDEKRNPSTIVAALLLNMDCDWKPIRDAVEEAIVEYIKPRNLKRCALKGKEIYHRIERGDDKASALMASLMVIPEQCRVPVFYAGVHRAGFRYQMTQLRRCEALEDTYRPFKLAFQNCMQKVETYVHTAYREEVLWIHDEGSLEPAAKESLRNWREFVEVSAAEIEWMKNRQDIPAHIESHVPYVVDMIYFGNDEESRILQLVDSCCSTIARHLREDAFAEPFYELLVNQIVGKDERPLYENAEEIFASIRAAEERARARRSE